MTLRVVWERPPQEIYDACDKAFGVRGKRGVIWTIGPLLYNPDRIHIDPALFAHEQVHSNRQLASGDVPGWWNQYLADKEFRFAEELVAHKEEWRVIRETVPSRTDRRRQLAYVTDRLSGSLYGNLVSRKEARRLIVGSAEA